MAAPNAQQIADEFTKYYYNLFDNDRKQLQPLYTPESILSWEGAEFKGTEDIMEKLNSLEFGKVARETAKVDAQISNPTIGSVLVVAQGAMRMEGSELPLPYCQVFHLFPFQGQYVVVNDIFRLVIGK